MDWYYVEGRSRIGPLDEGDFRRRLTDGTVTGVTLVWHEGMTGWSPFRLLAPPDEARDFCCRCARYVATDDMLRYHGMWVCAGCKPLFFQQIRTGLPVAGPAPAVRHGGFWIRFLGKMLDAMIVLPVMILAASLLALLLAGDGETLEAESTTMSPVSGLLVLLVALGVLCVYLTLMVGKFGMTVGKMACGLKVVAGDGGRVTYKRAFGRALVEAVALLAPLLGAALIYGVAAFDKEKRGLHDLICNTRVVYR